MLALHFAWPVHQWNLGMARWWGLPPALLGAACVVASARRFARAETTLRPAQTPSRLVTDGLFRFSRNPMYAGMWLSLAGAAVMLGSVTPLAALPLFPLLIGTRFIAHEERVLERRFGDAYRAYRRRVRRWI